MSAQNQATDRAYRIGQVNNVQVYKLIMKNNTNNITKMSTSEIISLFSND